MCSVKATHSGERECISADACLCSDECNWGRVFTEIYKYSPSSNDRHCVYLWILSSWMCRMLRHNPKQSNRCATFFSSSSTMQTMILITNKTIDASKMERRRWLHNQALWGWRQLNPKSCSVIVNTFNSMSEQAGNDKFFKCRDDSCWCNRDRESTEWKHKPLTSLMMWSYDLGGDRYIREPVNIKVCLDEMKAQWTEWCAPYTGCTHTLPLPSHFRGKAGQPFVKGIMGWVNQTLTMHLRTK